MATLTTLISFNYSDGFLPQGSLIADSNGDLFGTTYGDDSYNSVLRGTVFEIMHTATGYASEPTTLVAFNGPNGADPAGSLIADSNGDLFGTTTGEHSNYGTVFEIGNTVSGYASQPTTLASFYGPDNGPYGAVITDADGDLFGTTYRGGDWGPGTVFEVAHTATGYASAPTTLVTFYSGAGPFGSLIADANGDLFGTTQGGGAYNDGTMFEIVRTATGYATTPTTLVSFNGTDGGGPRGDLIVDANGDLFGTTSGGGTYGDGTVFEIAKTATGYASTPTTLVNFNGTDGSVLLGSLIADAAGDLFGVTYQGGAYNDGTVFEIAKTSTGYVSSPITLVSFNGPDGGDPAGSLVADANGNLFGTTRGGGANGWGTVFEVTHTGFVVGPPILAITGISPDTGISATDGLADQTITVVNGTAAASTTVTIYAGTTVIGTGAPGADGKFSVTLTSPLAAQGSYSLTATTTDADGAVSAPCSPFTATVDETAPSAPSITGIGPDFGVSATDGVTDQTVTVVNGTAEADSTVNVYAGATMIGTATSGTDGAFSVTLASPLAAQGSHSLTATATDAAGNVSSVSSPFAATVDETRPTVLSVSASPEPADLGSGQQVTLTVAFSEAVYVTGTPALRLPARWGGATFLGGSGTAALTFAYTVQPGQNTRALAVYGFVPSGATIDDAAGNPANLAGSAMTLAGPVTIDTTGPAVTERLVADTGMSQSDGLTANADLIGRGDPNALVTFTEDGTTLGTTTAGTTGTWTWTPGLADGTHSVVASETDGAGNTRSASLTFTLEATQPTVVSVVASPVRTYLSVGQTVTLTVDLSQAVYVTGAPTLRLNDGGMASYVGGSGTEALTFAYTIGGGQHTPALAAKGIVLAGGATIEDRAGLATNLSGSVTALAGPVIINTEHALTAITVGAGQTVDAGSGNDVVTLGEGNAAMVFHGSNDIAFLGGGGAVNATISDLSSGLTVDVVNGGNDVFNGFANDRSAVVDLLGGIGGYTNVAGVLVALTDDGAGGSSLPMGAGQSIDFTGVALGALHAANFHIG